MSEVRLLYGPPGTGKTSALLDILDKELEHTAPSRIAFVSFTKEGVDQGKNRAKARFNLNDEALPYFRTLHSIAFRAGKMNVASVMSKKDYALFSKKVGMHFTGFYTEDFKNNDDMYLHYDNVYRNTPGASSFFLDYMDADKLSYVRNNYVEFKRHFGLYDYTDMIEDFVKRCEPVNVDVALLDEAQDLTALMWKMVWVAFSKCRTIYIVGDDDQAIYQWSGADVPYFLALEGESTVLRQSHRVPHEVWKLACSISTQIKSRVTKRYNSTAEKGEVTYSNSIEELIFNPDKTYMILSRNSYFLNDVISYLRQKGYMYYYKGKCSIVQQDIHTIAKYEALRTTGEKDLGMCDKMKKGASFSDPWYISLNYDEEYATYLRTWLKHKRAVKKITVSTIHGVKGAEADHVVLFTDMTKRTYENLQRNPDSEHRVFYVGATRAKERLTIMYPSTRYSYPIISEEELKDYDPD